MIIVEEPHVRKTQFNAQFNFPVATSSTPLIPTESPPAYTPQQDPGLSSSYAPPYHDPPSLPVTQKRQPKPAATRFFEALLLALGICAATVFVVKVLTHTIDGPWDDVCRTCHSLYLSVNFGRCSEATFPNLAPQDGWTSRASRWENHPLCQGWGGWVVTAFSVPVVRHPVGLECHLRYGPRTTGHWQRHSYTGSGGCRRRGHNRHYRSIPRMGNIQGNHYVLDGTEEGRTRGWDFRKYQFS